MQNRPTLRHSQQLARKLAKAYRSMSYTQVAKLYGITTPANAPNPRMVKHLIDGYRPRREDTLRRCGLLIEPQPVIHDAPIRRVLTGAWRLFDNWVSPEEYFKWNNC